ncbi:MAG TPA: response regulator [Verrucomicrobiae bacterium]|nr:response regulator [Verrucomicrobiae bacterium]
MKTVLHIDDNPNDLFLVERACRNGRVRFLLKAANCGTAAIRYLRGIGEFTNRTENPVPDLILLDLKMPEMDGIQVLRWIRTNPSTKVIPVAIFSASLIPGDITKSYAEGADYFIIKPSALATLIEIVRAADEFLASKNGDALTRFSEPKDRR